MPGVTVPVSPGVHGSSTAVVTGRRTGARVGGAVFVVSGPGRGGVEFTIGWTAGVPARAAGCFFAKKGILSLTLSQPVSATVTNRIPTTLRRVIAFLPAGAEPASLW